MYLPASYQRVIELASRPGGVRARDIVAAGLYAAYADRLVASGHLVKVARGTYAVPATSKAHSQLAELGRRSTKGVVCLTSALHFHGLIKTRPSELWVALGTKDRRPARLMKSVRFVHFSPTCLEAGVEVRRIDGVEVRVFSAAKSVADAFKFRSKVGVAVALEALRAFEAKYSLRGRDLQHAARICRVELVLRPYVEAVEAAAATTARRGGGTRVVRRMA